MHNDPFGVLIVDKEKGMTSHDVVDLVRRRFRVKKVGHAGTLDPNATGVLILLLGQATKFSSRFASDEKEYVGTMKLGERTSSSDCDGRLIEVRDTCVSEEKIKEVVSSFIGEIEQIPPMVSAKWVGGERLYKLARKGIEIDRKAKIIFIRKIEIEEIKVPLVRFSVVCSKGTYVRQLVDDIGEKLGCGAHLVELRRVRSGLFSLDRAIPISNLVNMGMEELNENILRV